MTKWEQLEEYLYEEVPLGGRVGSNAEIASALGETTTETSQIIQAYLDAQRSRASKTLYVLRRRGRTTSAVWYSGIRTADMKLLGKEYFIDVRQKFLRALEPDLKRLSQRNPRAAKKCASIIIAVGDGAMTVLQAAVGGMIDEDEE